MNEMDVFASFFSNSYMEDNYASNQLSQQQQQSQQESQGQQHFNVAVPIHQQIYVINEDSQENASHHLIVNTEDNQNNWNNEMQICNNQQPNVNPFQELFVKPGQVGEQGSQQRGFQQEHEEHKIVQSEHKNLANIEEIRYDCVTENPFQQKLQGVFHQIENSTIDDSFKEKQEEEAKENQSIISNKPCHYEEQDNSVINSPKEKEQSIQEKDKRECVNNEKTIMTPISLGKKNFRKPQTTEQAQVQVNIGFNYLVGASHSQASKSHMEGNIKKVDTEENHKVQYGNQEQMIQSRIKMPIKQFLDFDQDSLFSLKNQSQKSSRISKYSAQPTRIQVSNTTLGATNVEESNQKQEIQDQKEVVIQQCQLLKEQKQNQDQQENQSVYQRRLEDVKSTQKRQEQAYLEVLSATNWKESIKSSRPQTPQTVKEVQQELKQPQQPSPVKENIQTGCKVVEQCIKPLESIPNSSGILKTLQTKMEPNKESIKDNKTQQKGLLNYDRSNIQKKGFKFEINMDAFQHLPKSKITTSTNLFEVTQRSNTAVERVNGKENNYVSNRISTPQTDKTKSISQYQQPQQGQLPSVVVKKGGFDLQIPEIFGNTSKTVIIQKREKRRPSTENAAMNQATLSINNPNILSLGAAAQVNSIAEQRAIIKQTSSRPQIFQQQQQMFQQQNNQQQQQFEVTHKQKQQQQLQHQNSLSPFVNLNPLLKPSEPILKSDNYVITLTKKLLYQMSEFERLNKHLDVATVNSCEQKWEAQFLMEQQADLLLEIKDSVTRLRRVQ